MNSLEVPRSIVAETLSLLQQAGRRSSERVVLWLGRRREEGISVTEAYLPLQEADYDFFHLPPESMHALMTKLRAARVMVAAQVHTHPGEAFHSEADDAWAIVRHVGALSFVVPDFALETDVSTFCQNTSLFVLSEENVWTACPPSRVPAMCQIR